MRATDARAVDLVVIGAGTAGIVAARTAVRLGVRPLLVAADTPGGDCLFTGCVPSKALIAAASEVHAARTTRFFGVSARDVGVGHSGASPDGGPGDSRADARCAHDSPGSATGAVDFAAVMRHVHGAIAAIAPSDSAETLERGGIEVLRGEARFTGPASLDVSGVFVSFGRAIVCTGAAPRSFPGALTSDTFWGLTALPERLLIIGGGPVGCEIAGAMARLGSAVTLVQRGLRLLPGEDSRASAILLRSLGADGVRVLLDAEVLTLDRDADGLSGVAQVRARSVGGGAAEIFRFDAALAATGREPRIVGLDFALAGVETDAAGAILTDPHLRTTNPRVWAAGDVTSLPRFTHTASANAELAVTNALGSARSVVDPVVARVTYTSPEVASVGETTEVGGLTGTAGTADPAIASQAHIRRVLTFEHCDLDRAIVDGQSAGFTSIVVDGVGVILGATIVGPRAGETLGELALAVRLRLTTDDLAATTHAYPGYGYAVRKLALQDVRARARGAAGGDEPHP